MPRISYNTLTVTVKTQLPYSSKLLHCQKQINTLKTTVEVQVNEKRGWGTVQVQNLVFVQVQVEVEVQVEVLEA